MCGKPLVKNLVYALGLSSNNISIPIYTFDLNQTRELPCIVVSYDSEQSSMAGVYGHYTVSGKVIVAYQGYEDDDNSDADSTAQTVITILNNDIESTLNKPVSGTDMRPVSGFGINRLFVRGTNRIDEDHSTMVEVNFEAFAVAKDFN